MNQHCLYAALRERPKFLGCDRELCMLLCLICIALAVCAVSLWAFIAAALLFLICFYLLRLMAKHDLMLRQVYLRNLRYRRWYAAQPLLFSRPWRKVL